MKPKDTTPLLKTHYVDMKDEDYYRSVYQKRKAIMEER